MRYIAVPQSKTFFLTDITFWADHEEELKEWCCKNFCLHRGMTVTALNEYSYMLFGLRWSD